MAVVSGRQSYTLAEISAMLAARAEAVARQYAPEAPGSYTLGDQYFTLNPGRPDKSVGSFMVNIGGSMVGRWKDFATGDSGDLIDLIRLRLQCDARTAILEARAYLGLDVVSPELAAARRKEAQNTKRLQEVRRQTEAEKMERRRKAAHALWLASKPLDAGSPAVRYLEGRGIALDQLDRLPSSLRFHPECYYKHMDPKTGEVFKGRYPAMVALAHNKAGKTVACHRTYLALRGGMWTKADLPEVKKVLGKYAGASIRVWAGAKRDGKRPPPLAKVPQDSQVFIAEGIEDALSCAVILPQARILSAISLANMGRVELPPAIAHVTLIADEDDGDQAQEQLHRAIDAHSAAGRQVRLWRNKHGGKDLNDALRGVA
ncbi:MAG: toprim domain-containing protein [Pseudomonadota bacterium]